MLDKYYDYPAILVGSIERRYLDTQPHDYEAGIRSKNFNKITISIFQPLGFKMSELNYENQEIPYVNQFLEDIKSERFTAIPSCILDLYDNDKVKLVEKWREVSSTDGQQGIYLEVKKESKKIYC